MGVGAAIAGIGGSLISGGLSAWGANKAANQQKNAANKASAQQLKMFRITRGALKPYRRIGAEAFKDLGRMYGLIGNNPQAFNEKALKAFQNSPDYIVARDEGIRALDASAAAQGNLLSGGQIKGVMDYGSMLGSKMFGSYLGRLADMAGLGENAAAGSGNAAIQTGRGLANTTLAAGQAAASGTVGMVNAANNAIGGGINNFALYTSLNKNPSAYGGGSTGVT